MRRLPFPRRTAALAAAAVCLAVAAGLWYGRPRPVPSGAPDPGPPPPIAARPDPAPRAPPPPDPREVFPTPFRNVRPGVAYVGDAACAACHADLVKSFHAHPMGRSAEWVARAARVERYEAAAKDVFGAEGFEFRVERARGGVTHRVSVPGGRLPDYVARADVAIGSGTRGRAYLSVEDGAVWQSPVSWFSDAGRWDLSPMNELDQGGRRAIVPACLFCHTDRVEAVPGAENRYREPLFPGQVSIGCERCHGPGELHVAGRRAGREPAGDDDAIVNPRHLPADLRADVCRQCHLQGVERVVRRGRDLTEYRPGLPWEQFVSVFVLPPDAADYRKSVGQFEQMEASRCFAGSGGKLGCTSCHDPHHKPTPAEAEGFFRERCLACHESKGCSLPAAERRAKDDRCVACHMPRRESSTIAHASVTDHRVPRRPGADVSPPAAGSGSPFVPYPAGPHAAPAEERDRDWGIAAARVAGKNPENRSAREFAAERLGAAVKRWPDDAEAWAALAAVRGAGGDKPGAVEAARAAVAADPRSETALGRLALEARLAGDLDTALPAADELVRMNPTSLAHRVARADVYLRRHDWARAEAEARAALALQPLYWQPRLYLAVCRYHQADPAGAREEATTAAGLIPDQRLRAAYMSWYREQIR
jgi:hypothetical protein